MTQIKNRTLPEEQPAGRQPRGKNSLGSGSTFWNSRPRWALANETAWAWVLTWNKHTPGVARSIPTAESRGAPGEGAAAPGPAERAALPWGPQHLTNSHKQHKPGPRNHHQTKRHL